jgi:hypothetical protein
VAVLEGRAERLLALIYVLWAMASVFAGADRSSSLRGFRLPSGDHLNEMMRVETWFLGAVPISGHPSTVGVTGPGPWYLYVTALPTRLLGPLMGGNYLQASMLVNILLCAGLLLCAMRMARTLTGHALGPVVVFSATVTLSLVNHRISPSPLMTRPATVGYYAAICLVLGVLVARREEGKQHLLPAVFSAVLLFHSYMMNIPFVVLVGSTLLIPVLAGVRRREARAAASLVLVVAGAAQTIAGWVLAPETLRFYFAGPARPESTDLVRNELLGTFTTTRPLYNNEITWWPPTVELDRLGQSIGTHAVWLIAVVVLSGVVMVTITMRDRLVGMMLTIAWLYWSYLSLRPYLLEHNAYALTPAVGIAVAAGVVALTLRSTPSRPPRTRFKQESTPVDGARSEHKDPVRRRSKTPVTGHGNKLQAFTAAVLLCTPMIVAVTYEGSYWYSGKGQFFTLHKDQGDPYHGIADALRDSYGENRSYALLLDDVENRVESGADYRGAAVTAWLALNLQGERSCVLLKPHHRRNEAITLAAVIGTKGLCERETMGPGTVELTVIYGTGEEPGGEAVFVSANRPPEQSVQVFPSTGGLTLTELMQKHSG